MSYKIYKNDSNVIEVTYTGSVNLDERKRAVEEACQLIRPTEPVRLLIDVRKITMNMSEQEQMEFGIYLAHRKELLEAKVAVLHNPKNNPNTVIDIHAYLEGYQLGEFDNEREAILWLIGELN